MGKYDNISFKPPSGAVSEAKRGLAWRSEHGRGGTEVGIARARDIAGGKNMSPETVKRMKAFFDRHASDKNAEGWSPGEKGFPSNGRIAHALWGGSPGYSWAKKVVRQMEAADSREATNECELRLVAETPGVEVREEDNGKTVCRGYAALFNSESRDLGGFVEVIERGAFDRVLADPATDVICKLDHERPLARTPGTLRLGVDERGLWYEFDPKRADADVVEALERGDLRGSSFAFRLGGGDDRWEKRDDGTTIRTITNFAGLYDVGPVYTPAYPETSSWVSKRALDMAASLEHPVLADAEEADAEEPVPVEDPLAEAIAEAREALLQIQIRAAIQELS
jgi:uncharacterized protein